MDLHMRAIHMSTSDCSLRPGGRVEPSLPPTLSHIVPCFHHSSSFFPSYITIWPFCCWNGRYAHSFANTAKWILGYFWPLLLLVSSKSSPWNEIAFDPWFFIHRLDLFTSSRGPRGQNGHAKIMTLSRATAKKGDSSISSRSSLSRDRHQSQNKFERLRWPWFLLLRNIEKYLPHPDTLWNWYQYYFRSPSIILI